jgi:hypothetical protein
MRLDPGALILNDYTFFEISVKGSDVLFENRQDSLMNRPIGLDDFDAEIQSVNPQSQGNNLIVELKLKSLETNFKAKFSLTTVGSFTLQPELESLFKSDTDFNASIVAIGAGMLYSAARDQLHTSSLKMPYGPIILPLCNFSNIERMDADAKSQQKIKLPIKKKTKAPGK